MKGTGCSARGLYSERPQGAGLRWVNPAERWRENPARALAGVGFSQHLECRIHWFESSPSVRENRDTVNPPRGFDQSAMLTNYRVWDYSENVVLPPMRAFRKVSPASQEVPRRQRGCHSGWKDWLPGPTWYSSRRRVWAFYFAKE